MIVGVAIRSPNEKIMIKLPKPNRHYDCFKYAIGDLGVDFRATKLGSAGKNQGFYTHTGKYLDREQASKYVRRTHQKVKGKISKYLFSEDLW